jgi:hypothetical protein
MTLAEEHRRHSAARRQEALQLKNRGLSYRQVGLRLGVRKARARQLVALERDRIRRLQGD